MLMTCVLCYYSQSFLKQSPGTTVIDVLRQMPQLSTSSLRAHLSREFICLLLITNKLCTAVSVIYDTRTGIVSQSFSNEISSVFADLSSPSRCQSQITKRHLNTHCPFIVVQLLSAKTNHCIADIAACPSHWSIAVHTGL